MDSKKANTIKRLHVIIERIELQRAITLWCMVFAAFVTVACGVIFFVDDGSRYVTGFMFIAMSVYMKIGIGSRRGLADYVKTLDDLIINQKEQSN